MKEGLEGARHESLAAFFNHPRPSQEIDGLLGIADETSSRTSPSSGVIHPRCNDDRQNREEPSVRVRSRHERAVPACCRLRRPRPAIEAARLLFPIIFLYRATF